MATHISRHLYAKGHQITCIWSRTPEHAGKLAEEFGTKGTSDHGEVPMGADFYIISLPDKAIPGVAAIHRGSGGIWIHNAGAVSRDIFEGYFREYGVIYPLQTLSSGREVSLGEIPFLVEGSSQQVTEKVRSLARSFSGTVFEMDSQQRLVVHLAAVFANNFSNHMVTIAQQILKEQDADPSLLSPILKETFSKLDEMGPERAQTGPALRSDTDTMEKHLELLKGHPEWENLYTFVSRDIEASREKPMKDRPKGDDQL